MSYLRVFLLCDFRVTDISESDRSNNSHSLPFVPYDNEKYKEMILDAAETVLGLFGFDRTIYSSPKRNSGRKKWYEGLREQRARDVETEML